MLNQQFIPLMITGRKHSWTFVKHCKTDIVGIKVDKGRDVIKPVELATLLNEKFQSIFTTETLGMPDLLNRPSP